MSTNCKSIIVITALLLAAPLLRGDDAADRALIIKACLRCHELRYDVTPRSKKSWELTIVRMQYMVAEDDPDFTKEKIKRMVNYFAKHFGEKSTIDPYDHFPEMKYEGSVEYVDSPSDSEDVAPEPDPLNGGSSDSTVAAVPPRKELSEEIRYRLAHPRWKPSPLLKRVAKWSGYSAVLFTLILLTTGHLRRKLKRRFKPVHAVCALGLFLSLAAHGVIYLVRYGNPMVLWYWLGIISFALLVLAQIQGIVRKKFGKLFVRIHVTAGYLSLALAIGHWIVAWF